MGKKLIGATDFTAQDGFVKFAGGGQIINRESNVKRAGHSNG